MDPSVDSVNDKVPNQPLGLLLKPHTSEPLKIPSEIHHMARVPI